jgi:N-methylhydantoinase B
MQEVFYPYRIEAKRLRTDSGGPGRQRGGLGVEKIYRILSPCSLIVAFDRTVCPPWGLEGGGASASAFVQIVRSGGEQERITKGERQLLPGDIVHVFSGGGGGYGPSHERDIAAVLHDIRQGYVSEAAAEREYGVVLSALGSLDTERTQHHRDEMKRAVSAP